MVQGARWALAGALIAGGLAMVVVLFGESLWALTAPPDRLGLMVADDAPGPAGQRGPDTVASVIAPSTRAGALPAARASQDAGAPVTRQTPDAVARVGARITVPAAAPTEAAADAADLATAPGELAVTMEVQGGRTIYRMNGDLVVDPDRQREDLVEAGFEYRFGMRGLEKVKLWEVRR